jgi:hypothetical protein
MFEMLGMRLRGRVRSEPDQTHGYRYLGSKDSIIWSESGGVEITKTLKLRPMLNCFLLNRYKKNNMSFTANNMKSKCAASKLGLSFFISL